MKIAFDKNIIDRIGDLIATKQNVVITCHKSPDGDAIGSSLALLLLLKKLNKNVSVVIPDKLPKVLMFLPCVGCINVNSETPDKCKSIVESAEIIFCLDFNSIKRIDLLGVVVSKSNAIKIMIDHHEKPDESMCEYVISESKMSSTCELVYHVLIELGFENLLDEQIATCIYTGLVTDTGNFSYNSNSPELFRVVAKLLEYNVNKDYVYAKAINCFAESSLRLMGFAIAEKMIVDKSTGGALIVLTAEELKRFGYRKGDTEGLVNKPLSIPGVFWSTLMREDENCVKISMRSVGRFAVNSLCEKHFDGGGHINAAGGEFYGTIDEAIEAYNKMVEKESLTINKI